jgi:uncharacterized protein YbbC (DUF1343 family)
VFSCTGQDSGHGRVSISVVKNDKSAKTEKQIRVGAERTGLYLNSLQNKRVAIVGNQTTRIGEVHLVDSLLSLSVNLVKVFSPEHGFRGDADAGEKVDSNIDTKTGLPIISLYASNKKPTKSQLEGIDVVVFDIQDVGVRFYTYISTLHYVMEACAESNIEVIILDRPNPNGHIVDGPIRKDGFESFVGMHPVPILHGMTIGEYGKMINGENWLKNNMKCSLSVIPCENYTHEKYYPLPVYPSPNLRSNAAIALYPSLCLFEGTIMSVGRGTDFPFEVFGHPDLKGDKYDFHFKPQPNFGAKNPKLKGETCYGRKLAKGERVRLESLNIEWVYEAYKDLEKKDFFKSDNGRWFDLLAGNDQLRKDIIAGKSILEIKSSWKDDLEKFAIVRGKYLIY